MELTENAASSKRAENDRKRKWKSQSDKANSSKFDAEEISSFKVRHKEILNQTVNNRNDFVPPFLRLPTELLAYVVYHLRPIDIGNLATTCTRFNEIIQESHIWKSLYRQHYSAPNCLPGDISHSSNPVSWKRQYCLNFTKAIKYQQLGSNGRGRTQNEISGIDSATGFKKLCCSRDHVFALDSSSCLHVFRNRFERDAISNEFVYKKATWHQEFSKNVVDVTADPRYDNNHRRYVYVLTQSEAMRMRRNQPNTRSTHETSNSGWNENGNPVAGDKIDVFDERSCRRVFNMTFDPEMRFVSMKLTSIMHQKKTLYILTDQGKVYSLHLFESSLLNLGSEGMQVTLKSASKTLGEKVTKIETSVGVVGFITGSGKLYVVIQKKSEFIDIFGREAAVKLSIPQNIPHVAKILHCSLGDHHLGFIDEYNRAFVVGNNRHGQLGTGDRMDRCTPVQVLNGKTIRILYCSLNHTMAVVEENNKCEILGAGCGHSGRLPGKSRGSVEFVKLDIKVPWGIRQIDSHKKCIYLLSCYDINEKSEYKIPTQDQNQQFHQLMSLKSQKELLIDLKKAGCLLEKIRIMEAMTNKINFAPPPVSNTKEKETVQEKNAPILGSVPTQTQSNSPCSSHQMVNYNMLKLAVEQLRIEAEKIEVDKQRRLNKKRKLGF